MMKKMLVFSCVLFLGACSAETAEKPQQAETVVASETKGLDVWSMPRQLHSLHEDEMVSIALEREALGDGTSVKVLVKNNGSTALELSSQVTVLNRLGENMARLTEGPDTYDRYVVEPGDEVSATVDLESFGLTDPDIRQAEGLAYTIGIPINDTIIPLDVYTGDAQGLIAAMGDLKDWVNRDQK